jgi:hypothetical protein
MMGMGRKSTARKLLEELPGRDSLDRTLLVLYDFHGGPPHPRFYANLHRITELTEDGSSLVQYSAYRTKSLKAALTAQALASGMGAEVAIYEITERSPEDLRRSLKETREEVHEGKSGLSQP